MRYHNFEASGTNSATAILSQRAGQIIDDTLNYDSPGAGTLVVWPATMETTASAAVSNSATLVIDTDASGYVDDGAVLTTSDGVIVYNSSGTGNGVYFRTISAVAAVSSSTVSLTLASAIYCSADDVVCIIRDASKVTLTTADETINEYRDMFVGCPGYPLAIVLTATGTCRLSGRYHVQ